MKILKQFTSFQTRFLLFKKYSQQFLINELAFINLPRFVFQFDNPKIDQFDSPNITLLDYFCSLLLNKINVICRAAIKPCFFVSWYLFDII